MAQLQQRVPARATAGAVLLLCGAFLGGSESPAQQREPPGAPRAAPPAPQPVVRRPLDLRAPDIRRIVPPAALREPLPTDGDDVTIESRRSAPPDPARQPVPGGLVAPFWAIRHPSQAWRIFAPDPNARAAERPDPVPRRTP